jgi:V8-like Glu-specific endopeptidase
MHKAAALLACSFALTACADPPAAEPVGTSEEPIVGGVADTWRTYVVGVGNAQQGPFCSGTVISRRTVLTAGHCWGTGINAINRVFFGNNIITSPSSIVPVLQAIRHPQWDGQTLSHDLTIVQLASDAPSQPGVMLRETMDNSSNWIGPNFSYVGYGVNNGHTQAGFGVRRVVAFPINLVGPGTTMTEGTIDDTQYYYSASGKNTCNGDSGGPAFVVRQIVERLSGTTSYGDQFCTVDGVNARADEPEIMNWIQGMIDQFEGTTDDCRADGVCDESCNVNNTLVDPDCAPNHCGADGMCVLSCVMPVDPDCTGLNRCGFDGACDPSCPSFDPDCTPLCGADGICVPTCPTLDPDCANNCGADGICVTACPMPDPDCSMTSSVASSTASSTVASTTVASTTVSSTTVSSTTVSSTTVSSTTVSVSSSSGVGGFGGFGGAGTTVSSTSSSFSTTDGVTSTTGVGGQGGAGGSGVPDAIVTSGCPACAVGDTQTPRAPALVALALASALANRRRRGLA